MRPLILFIIGIVFGTAGGFLIAGGLGASADDHAHSGAGEAAHDHSSHDHSELSEWPDDLPAPDIALTIWPDVGRDMNLRVDAAGFTFTPEDVNGDVTPATGHAHIYVNGEKIARLYGPYAHLTAVPEGAEIRVTLNANDHTEWAVEGVPLAAAITAP
jgi:hypothetical protein